MLNKKGMTLIESLFAFSIYITILVLFVGLMSQGLKTKIRLESYFYSDKDVVLSQEFALKDVAIQALR